MVRYGVFVAARCGSSRLPGKALLPLSGLPMVAYLLRRLKGSRLAGRVVLATTDLPEDDRLEALAAYEGVPAYRGDRADLVKRFVDAARRFPCEYAVRVTADCPFVDAATLDHCLAQCDAGAPFDIASTKTRFPVGIDFEVYHAARMEALLRAGSLDAEEREHLTLHMYRHPDRFRLLPIHPPSDWSPAGRTFTVDTPEDYRFASQLADRTEGWGASVKDILTAAARP